MKWLIKKLKQLLRTKNHEHEIVYHHGYGYRCKYCGQPKNQCISKWERKKTHVGV